MSDWRKVRVTFQDADGNEVSAVMWETPEYKAAAYANNDHSDVGVCVNWALGNKRVTVTPIPELPTGVGAVIRVTDYGKNTFQQDAPGPYGALWMLGSEGWIHRGPHRGDPFKPFEIASDGWQYEILSEGIQIGGVK